MTELQTLKVDRTKLYTQAAYAVKLNVSRQRVNQLINEEKLTIVEINGTTLVYCDN